MSQFYAPKTDMMLLSRICPFTKPENIPLSYTIGPETYHGIPQSFSPSVSRNTADANLTVFTVTGTHPSGLTVRAEARMYRDFPVVEWIAYFENHTKEKSPVVSDIRITGILSDSTAPTLIHSNGDTCREDGYEIYRDTLENPVTLAPAGGTPCCGASPYMRVLFDTWGVNLAIGWTGMWSADFEKTSDGVRFSVGQRRCHMAILPGETMRTPMLTMMAFTDGEDNGRNLWRKWYLRHILPRENGAPLPPKLCLHIWNVDGPEFTGTTTKKQNGGLDTYLARGMKPDIWWIDAGWYPCDFNWPHTGTWEHDTARFPQGLGEIGKHCEDNDVQFLVWFEPERVTPDTWLWDEHPDWLLHGDDQGNALLDLGNPDALAWLIAHVNQKIRDYHIHIYRQDFNFAPESCWVNNEAEDRIGAMENRHIQGYLAYWDALIDANPGLWIDSCASGGRRNDLDTMRRAVPLHYTDVGYGDHPIKQKQHRFMFEWIPYFRAHNMAWDKEDGTYSGEWKHPDRFSFHCALAPALTNMTFYDAPDSEYETAAVMVPIWRRAAQIELTADYYPLTECRKSPNDWYAMQFDDAETGEGFVQVIRNTLVPEDTYMLYMHVSDPEAIYFFENMETGDMMQLDGAQLTDGIPLTLERRSGVVWFYHKVSL